MKIADYTVQASASKSYQYVESNTTLITTGQKKTDEPKEPPKTEAGALEAGAPEDSYEKTDTIQQMLKDAAEQREKAVEKLKQASQIIKAKNALPTAYSPDEVKLSLLEMMIKALTGKDVKGNKIKQYDGNKHSGHHGQSNGAPQNQLPHFSGGNGDSRPSNVSIMSVERFVYESESVSYSAQGLINTADGQQISVDINMNMSRQFVSYESASIEFERPLCDPLVINYAGSAASLTDETYSFDLDFDGAADNINFAGEGSGFLAYDKNGDGKISDGRELFGPQTGSGFSELREYDQDGNGWIDENDDIYSKLSVWSKDKDGNDVLYSLKQVDVGAIYLGDVETQFSMTDSNNNTMGVMRSTSFFLKDSGGAGTISHIDLAI